MPHILFCVNRSIDIAIVPVLFMQPFLGEHVSVSGSGVTAVHMHRVFHRLMSLSSCSPAGGTVWKVVDILVQVCMVRLAL